MSKHRSETRARRRAVIGLGIVAAIVLLGTTAGPAIAAAINGHDITDGTVRGREIANGAEGVKSVDVTDQSLKGQDLALGTVGEDKLTPAVRDKLNAAPDTSKDDEQDGRLNSLEQEVGESMTGSLGNRVRALEANQVEFGHFVGDPTEVTDVGGPFGQYPAVRATLVGQFTLQPGTYLLNVDGFFITTTADANRDVRMQLAVRVPAGSGWGTDLGTGFTGKMSPLANREGTTSTQRLFTIEDPTTIELRAFGYEDDQGAGASGQISVQATATWTRLYSTLTD